MRHLCTALLTLLLWAAPARCIAWTPEDVLLGFGASYPAADGGSATHRGTDIRLDPGAIVEAPASGKVTFVGNVPSQSGGVVLAVSLETEHGKVTLLPLARATVKQGEVVTQGDEVATLAGSGDPSSGSSHLHLSLRRGDLYVDPAVLLTAAIAPEPDAKPQPQPSGSPAPDPSVTAQASPVGAPVASGAPAVTIGDPVPSAGAAQSQAPVMVTDAEPTTAHNGAQPGEIADGVTLSSNQVVPAADRTAISGGQTAGERVLKILRSSLGEPLGIAALVASAMVSMAMLSHRVLERRLVEHESVSDRLGTLLQHMRAGDTLRGLNSCSGHDAFTVPGPPAQRR